MPDITLFTSPRACSTACHIALAESGLDYDIEIVRIREGQHLRDEYLVVNPWGKIPAMRIDDRVLTEAHAILSFIADAARPAVRLLPEAPLARASGHEWMSFLAATVHIAFRPLFRPQYLIGDQSLYPKLRETGIPNLQRTLAEVDRRLAGRNWALGDEYSVVDPYLAIFWIWSQRDDVIPHVAGMPHWQAHAERVFARPATWQVLEREGITKDNITDP